MLTSKRGNQLWNVIDQVNPITSVPMRGSRLQQWFKREMELDERPINQVEKGIFICLIIYNVWETDEASLPKKKDKATMI